VAPFLVFRQEHAVDTEIPPSQVETSIVVLPAEVDLATSAEVRDRLLSTVNRGGVHLIVDATAVTFMDSSGVNALVRARERAERLDGSIHVVTTSRAVLRVLQVTQLDRLMGVVPSLDAALACVSRPATIHSCSARAAD
jgi:anti-anti-sigma factor